jgi:flagellar protein FlbT
VRKPIHISLRAGERIFINGAVLRVDRKVSIEFLNDVTFLLEHHVMQEKQADTPLKAHYFILQAMLVDPASATAAREMFVRSHPLLLGTFDDPEIRAGLEAARDLVAGDKVFEALKAIRALFPLEDAILAGNAGGSNPQPKVASCR